MINILISISLGVFVCSKSLYSFTGLDLNGISIICLLVLLTLNVLNLKSWSSVTNDPLLVILSLFVILSSLLSALVMPAVYSAIKFGELLSVLALLHLASYLKLSLLPKAYFIVVAVVTVQCGIILYDRTIITNILENYLLSTLAIGASAVILSTLLFYGVKKLLVIPLLLVHILALLNMQARGVAIFVMLFLVIYPVIYFKLSIVPKYFRIYFEFVYIFRIYFYPRTYYVGDK